MTGEEVDAWLKENGETDSYLLLDTKLPGMRAKLDRLDRRIEKVLAEVRREFPEAVYYTGGGGFSLVLGDTHEGHGDVAQQQRTAWGGGAEISDGDW